MHHLTKPVTVAILGVLQLFAQQQFAPYDDPRNLPYSPEVHPDRTLTLRLYAPNAREVLLVGPTIVAARLGEIIQDDVDFGIDRQTPTAGGRR